MVKAHRKVKGLGAKVRFARDMHRIELARRGVDVSAAAWVIPDSADTRPWPLPLDFRIEELGWEEIKVGMSLGILTIDVLTEEQQREYLLNLHRNVGHGTARRLLRQISDATAPIRPPWWQRLRYFLLED